MDVLLRYWLKYKKHLSKAVLGIFLLLTGGVGYYFLQEQGINPPPVPIPQVWEPQKIVTEETEDFLTTYSANVPPIHESNLAILTVLSVWEVRQGQSAEDLQKQALQLFQEAKREYDAGNLQRARGALTRALSIQPDYQEARNLQRRIDEELNSSE